jgi:hypothetical protein
MRFAQDGARCSARSRPKVVNQSWIPHFGTLHAPGNLHTAGPIAQCFELAADNRLVGSSSPPSPTVSGELRFPEFS